MDYFEFFGFSVGFEIDKTTLRQEYLSAIKRYQDDDEHMALSHQAYKTLAEDEKRIVYLLTLAGIIKDENQLPVSKTFLMEMMDLHEEKEQYPDAVIPKIQEMLRANQEQIENYLKKHAFPYSEVARELQSLYAERKYLQRMLS